MKKILVLRLSSIGDIVLTSPILRCLKEQIPSAEIHVLTKQQYKILYSSSPYVDKVFSWEEENHHLFQKLRKESYDYIVDLHKNIRTVKLRSILRKKGRSFPKLNIQKWLLVKFKWDVLPKVHIVDRYFEAVKHLGIQNDRKGLDFFIQINAEKFYQKFNFNQKYIVAAIGGKFATKKMPVSKLVEILEGLPLPIVLIGGKEEWEEGEEIKRKLSDPLVKNTCGLFSIHESAQIIKNAEVIITHDTGMMHIAAAFDLPIVSIWGNTVPEFGMYPYRPQSPNSYSIHEVKNLSCRPCSKLGYDKCPKGHFKCMLQQDTKEIQDTIKIFLKEKGEIK